MSPALSGLHIPFLIALVAAVGITAAVRGLARRYDLVVMPTAERWHDRPTALYGGVGITLAVLAALAITGAPSLAVRPELLGVVSAATLMFVVGLVDDARGMTPVGKLIFQLGAATLLVLAGVVYPLTPWNPVNVLATLFWFVGIVNAVNLLDNMDGIAAGVSAVAAAGLGYFFLGAGDPHFAAAAMAVAGAAGGFLVFNFKPATIFMGDGGSLFLGAMLAGLGAAYPLVNGPQTLPIVLVPMLVLLIPILDTTLVTVTRTIHNRRISVGGRDHSTHRLVAMGFSEARAALFLYALGAVALMVAWSVQALSAAAGIWLGLLFLTATMIFTGYLGRLHRYDDALPEDRRTNGVLLRNILLKRRGLELLLDIVLFGVAYYGAFLIYYDGAIPREMGAIANLTLGVAIVLKLAAFHYFGVYRSVWERPGLADVHRIIKATLLGNLLLVGVLFLAERGAGIPRTVLLMDALLTGALATAARSSFYSLDRFRRRLRGTDGEPVLIYGAGPEGEIALRALDLHAGAFWPIGFVDDGFEPGTLVQGLPVMGRTAELDSLLVETHVRYLVYASAAYGRNGAGSVRKACARSGVTMLSLDLGLSSTPEEGGRPQ